jgi:chromosome segregation ATPase
MPNLRNLNFHESKITEPKLINHGPVLCSRKLVILPLSLPFYIIFSSFVCSKVEVEAVELCVTTHAFKRYMAESEAARRVQALLDQLRPFAAESSELGSSSSEEREGDIQGEEGTAPPEEQPSLQPSSNAFEPNVQNAISFSQRQTELHHSAKHALSELKPSSARLDELRKLADSTGREQLSLADAARLRALEHNEELIHERDRLRNELDAATNRERSAEQELSQLKHSRGFGDSEAAELRGRAERAEETRNKLYTELEDARTKIKELSTQGSMYNDVSNRFEKESNRAAALERERDSLNDSLAKQQEECGRLRTELNEYIHRAELLERDKSHLSAELQHCKDEQRKLEGETERVKSELQSAHSAKDDLQERILSKGTEERSNYEAKLESELNVRSCPLLHMIICIK